MPLMQELFDTEFQKCAELLYWAGSMSPYSNLQSLSGLKGKCTNFMSDESMLVGLKTVCKFLHKKEKGKKKRKWN